MPSKPLEQKGEVPEGKHKTHVHGLRRLALDTLLASIALFAPATLPQPTHGQETEKRKQTVNKENITPTKDYIQKLITTLDDDRFRIREDASGELIQYALPWIREHQKHLPWKEWLSIQPTYSTEQQARLQRILALIEREELRLLWLPTKLKEANPDRENLSVSQALEELEKHAGIFVSIPESILKDIKPLESTLHGYSPYEALRLIREHSKKSFAISNDTTLMLEGNEDRHGYLSPSGATCAQLIVPAYQPDEMKTAFQLDFFSENKILLAYFSLLNFSVTTQEGDHLPYVSSYSTHGASFYRPHLNFERPKDVKTVNVYAKVRLVGHEPKLLSITDLSGPKTCESNICTVEYKSLKEHMVKTVNENGEEGEQSEGWLIEGTFVMPHVNMATLTAGFSALKLDIRDAHGTRIPIQSPWWNLDGNTIHWRFLVQEKPSSIILHIPDRPTEAIREYFFHDIPIVRPDFYTSRLGNMFEFIIPLEAPPPRRAPR